MARIVDELLSAERLAIGNVHEIQKDILMQNWAA